MAQGRGGWGVVTGPNIGRGGCCHCPQDWEGWDGGLQLSLKMGRGGLVSSIGPVVGGSGSKRVGGWGIVPPMVIMAVMLRA